MTVSLKMGTGSVTVLQNSTPPIDCSSGESTQDSVTLTPRNLTGQESDYDGDGCPDHKELQATAGSQMSGGLRDPFNPWDYFNPTHDGLNGVPDVLMVVRQYFHDDTDSTPGLPPYSANYNPDTDRTALGPNVWNLGPPNGQVRVEDILAVLKQYFHNCA